MKPINLSRIEMTKMLQPPGNPDELHAWILEYCQINVPRRPICKGHSSPFRFVSSAYFEPGMDLVVWAPRGGGKTRLAAVVTLLDLLHKPPASVRILGGSLEQSMKLWEHLHPDLLRLAESMIDGKPKARSIRLETGSTVAAIAQSQRAVRGLRVQKIRCDEVELFDPAIWKAAQLATRTSGRGVCGSIDAMSTLHTPWGLMHQIVEEAEKTGKRIIKWCLLEVLEKCDVKRDCEGCPLWEDCRGIAKTRCEGFVSIDDAIALKRRVSREQWEAEMLCIRPSVQGAVFPSFSPEIHVKEREPLSNSRKRLAVDFGFHNPFVCLWIETLADGSTFVFDEYEQEGRTVEEHITHIEARRWGKIPVLSCDPAGAARNEQTSESNILMLRRRGYSVRHRKSLIVDGLEQIRSAMKPALGPVRLFIHPRCTRLIKSIRNYRYSQTGGELPVKDGENDHMIDALRYHFVNSQEFSVKSKAY